MGIPKDVNAYAQTRYDSCMVCCHLLPLLRRRRSYSLNKPNPVGIFTNTELLPTLLKYVISDGEANQTILDSIRSLRANQVFNQCMQHSCQPLRIRLSHHLIYEDSFFVYPPLAHALEYIVELVMIFVGMPRSYGCVKTFTDVRNCK